MALKINFYREIFDNEQKWMELINEKLLNIIYLNLVLKPFYIEKRQELEQEYNLTNNKIMGEIIYIIDNIINEIERQYENKQNADVSSILPLFLTSQMNNDTVKIEEDNIKKHF